MFWFGGPGPRPQTGREVNYAWPAAAHALKAREAAAKLKPEEMLEKRKRLKRLIERRERMRVAGNDECGESGSTDEHLFDDDVAAGEEELGAEALALELETIEQHLRMLTGSHAAATGAAAAAAGVELDDLEVGPNAQGPIAVQHQRPGRSRVWKAFDRTSDRCTLPHPTQPDRVCNAPPLGGSGTSGHIRHLENEHIKEWLHIKVTGPNLIPNTILTLTLT